jgi:hypothetical protein
LFSEENSAFTIANTKTNKKSSQIIFSKTYIKIIKKVFFSSDDKILNEKQGEE